MQQKQMDTLVGFFIVLGIAALIFLAFKVSGLSHQSFSDSYEVNANFVNIGSLKVRAPVKIAGVSIGAVSGITLDPTTFKAKVSLKIYNQYPMPVDSTASILTEGLLGSNYVGMSPGYESENLKPGDVISDTHSALILEDLIGQFLFSVGDKADDDDTVTSDAPAPTLDTSAASQKKSVPQPVVAAKSNNSAPATSDACVLGTLEDPSKVVGKLATSVIDELAANKNKLKANPNLVDEIVRKSLLGSIDVVGMSRYVLTPPVWTKASESEQANFMGEFTNLIIGTYGSPLQNYNGQTVKVYPVRGGYDDRQTVQVHSKIMQKNGPEIPVDYKLVKKCNTWQAYDFCVDNVCMLNNYKQQFASIASSGGIQAVNNQLATHNKANGNG